MLECTIDIESFSEDDIGKNGLYHYSQHPSTAIEMLSLQVNDAPLLQWDVSQGPNTETLQYFNYLIKDTDCLFHAFNAQFERVMLWAVWGLNIPLSRWRCDMVLAYSYGFTGTLAQVGKQLGLPEHKLKWAQGTTLMRRFCKPRGRTSQACRDSRWNHHNDPVGWAEYKKYNRRDVEAEIAVARCFEGLPVYKHLWREWRLNQVMSDRGVPINLSRAMGAIDIDTDYRAEVMKRLQDISGLDNPNSRDQFLRWIKPYAPELNDLQAASIETQILNPALYPETVAVLEDRLALGKTGSKKYYAAQRAINADNRVRGMIQFGGAHTGRNTGRILQLHNLPRTIFKGTEYEDLAQTLQQGNLQTLKARWPEHSPFKLLTANVRSIIEASPEHTFFVGDYASIEVCVLAQLTRCTKLLDILHSGKDPYKAFACHMFNVKYDEVTKQQRNAAKPPTLGAGFGLSAGGMDGTGGLVAYSKSMGVDMPLDMARKAIKIYRTNYIEVTWFWDLLSTALQDVIERRVEYAKVNALNIYMRQDYLIIELPSKRCLFYYKPQVTQEYSAYDLFCYGEGSLKTLNGRTKVPQISYMGKNPLGKWTRVRTHPGKTTENAVQAIARDILYLGIGNLEQMLYNPIMDIHDEIVSEILRRLATRENFEKFLSLMVDPRPSWCKGWPIKASGYIHHIYRKD